MRNLGLVRKLTLACGLPFAMAAAGCVAVQDVDLSPPVVTLDVTVDDWPLWNYGHVVVDSARNVDAAHVLTLGDFRSLRAIATARDTGGVLDVQLHALIERACDPSETPVGKTVSSHESDKPRSPGSVSADRSLMACLNLEEDDFPECPSGSKPQGAVFVRIWAVGTNQHGAATTSPSITLTLQR